ncbi:MAG: YfhO family protein [Bacteroidales bacterium]|nr:YfhO family protein [Bacteroidales bacterium]
MNFDAKKILPYLTAVVLFLVLSIAYFSDRMEGKVMKQSDTDTYRGMSKEIIDFREQTGEEALWTNRMFGGMPAYLISVRYPNNILGKTHTVLSINHYRPASFLFLSMLIFFISMLMFGVNPWLSIVGSIAYAFSSFFLIFVEAGHLTKVQAMAYLPGIVASIYYAYKKKLWIGTLLLAIFLGTQLMINHLQITYYTLMIVIIMMVFILWDAIKEKTLPDFIKRSLILGIAVVLAIGINFPNLWLTYEYGKYSTRGKSELTTDQNHATSGLDKDYIVSWSYGVGETFTLLVPNFKGGKSIGAVGKNSKTYKLLSQNYPPGQLKQITKQLPLYFGDQPFTSGPLYLGAIIIFLFLMGIFLVKGNLRWWILLATILAIMLAWGKHFMGFTNIFIDYVPGYNKFRAVSTILIITQFTFPFLAVLALQRILFDKIEKKDLMKALKWSTGILGGLLLIFWLAPKILISFSSPTDANYLQQGATEFVNALKSDRQSMLSTDALRSLAFILLAAGTLFFAFTKKLQTKYAIAIIGLLVLIDLWGVDKRYVNSDNFVTKSADKIPYPKTPAFDMILRDKAPDYRVFNMVVSPFNDASTSYYMNSIGGYHGAKMERYQELIEHQISKNNIHVLNMLNTKYFIIPDQNNNNQPVVQMNPGTLGNAWFVSNYQLVANADSEINALTQFDPASVAIVDKRFEKLVAGFKYQKDSMASIRLTDYKPNHLTYNFVSKVPQLTVFSEIYYPKGWQAFIDGKPADHFRVDYVLRAMVISAGNHKIEFDFHPKGYFTGNKVALASSILLVLMALGILFAEFRPKKKKEDE